MALCTLPVCVKNNRASPPPFTTTCEELQSHRMRMDVSLVRSAYLPHDQIITRTTYRICTSRARNFLRTLTPPYCPHLTILHYKIEKAYLYRENLYSVSDLPVSVGFPALPET